MTTRRVRMKQAGPRRAFTVLEVLIVVVMIGLLAGLTVTSVARSSGRAEIERTQQALAARLALVRAQALLSGEPQRAMISLDEGDAITMQSAALPAEHRWAIPGQGTVLFELDGEEPMGEATIDFVPVGRASVREMRALRESDGGTIFVIRFDPISGEPRPEDRAEREQGGDP